MINYYFKMRKSIRGLLLLVCFLLFANTKVFANLELVIQQQEQQEKMLKGKVTDGNGNPLPGVYVVIKGTKKGTQVDFEGNYNLLVKESDVLVFSYVGMQTQKIAVKDKQTLDVILQESLGALDDIVVVAYGTQNKENLATNSTTVKAEAIENRPVANLTQALQGLAPNLIITPNQNLGGEPGTGMSIQIRGFASINSGGGSPLILIDGMEQDINTLDPNNIESVTVLEDVASSSIYGARGAFGVVLVITKRGTEPQFSYTGNFGNTNLTKIPEGVNGYEYATYVNYMHQNGGATAPFNEARLKRMKSLIGKPSVFTREDDKLGNGDSAAQMNEGNNSTDLFRELYNLNGRQQQHNFSVSGSGIFGEAEEGQKQKRFSYNITAGIFNQKGHMKVFDDRFIRKNAGINMSLDLNSWINLAVNLRYTRRDIYMPNYTGPGRGRGYDQMWAFSPLNAIKLKTDKGLKPSLWQYHYYRFEDSGLDKYENDNLGQVYKFTLEPIKNWKTFVNMRIRNRWRFSAEYSSIKELYTDMKGEAVIPFSDGSQRLDGRFSTQRFQNNYVSPQVYTQYEWKPENQKQYLKLMVGFEQESQTEEWLSARGFGSISNSVSSISTSLDPEKQAADGYSEWYTRSAFGSLSYTFDKKYVLNASYRYDGSSRFIKSKRFGGFFSWAVAYNLQNEAFLKPILAAAKIDDFKLRFSNGNIGNQNIELYQYIDKLWVGNNARWINASGNREAYSNTPGLLNSEATWESLKDMNFGFDLSVLNKRLTANFTYFIRTTSDMLGPIAPLPSTLGSGIPHGNSAELETKGFSLDLKWADKIGDFGYSARFLFSDAQSEITKYYNPKKILGNWYEGQKLGEIWGYETVGIMNAETAKKVEANSAASTTKGTSEFPNQNVWGNQWKEGDIRYKDLNGDGKITGGNNTAEIVIDDELKKRIKEEKLKVIYKDGKPILIKDKDGNTLNIGAGDRKIIGNHTPRYNYSADFNFSYKGFSLRMFFQGVGKRDLWAGDTGPGWSFWGMNLMKVNLDYYRAKEVTIFGHKYSKNTGAYYPAIYHNSSRNRQTQTRYLTDGSYIRLKNVTLSYAFDNELLKKTKFFKKASISLSGENLWTYSKMPEFMDPELTRRVGNGGPTAAYPLISTYSLGLNLTF